ELMQAWLDAHNRQDMKALEYMSDDVEIVEIPTGVVWRGRRDMDNLARLAYSRKSHKRLTRVFATDKEACVEYVTVVSTAGGVSDFEREHGLHGIDISNVNPAVDTFELPVCFVVRDPGWQDSPGTRVPGCRQPGAAAGRAWPPTRFRGPVFTGPQPLNPPRDAAHGPVVVRSRDFSP